MFKKAIAALSVASLASISPLNAEEKGTYEGQSLKTWTFYCENRRLDEV